MLCTCSFRSETNIFTVPGARTPKPETVNQYLKMLTYTGRTMIKNNETTRMKVSLEKSIQSLKQRPSSQKNWRWNENTVCCKMSVQQYSILFHTSILWLLSIKRKYIYVNCKLRLSDLLLTLLFWCSENRHSDWLYILLWN